LHEQPIAVLRQDLGCLRAPDSKLGRRTDWLQVVQELEDGRSDVYRYFGKGSRHGLISFRSNRSGLQAKNGEAILPTLALASHGLNISKPPGWRSRMKRRFISATCRARRTPPAPPRVTRTAAQLREQMEKAKGALRRGN
jgi:hypothetical protein